MAATREQSFVMDRIAMVGGDQVQITGGWHGIDRAYLRLAELLIRRPDGVTRVEPVPGSITGGVQRWSARFPIGAPDDVISLELQLGNELVVDLPWSGRSRRRFGRVRLPVQIHEDAGGAAEAPAGLPPKDDAIHGAVEAPTAAVAPPGAPAHDAPTTADEDDLVATHIALLTAREQLAHMEEELEAARATAGRAQEDAARAEAARERDAERSREALASLRVVAEEAVSQEQAKLQSALADRDAMLAQLEADAADLPAVRQRLESVEQQRDQLATRSRSELESAHARIAALEEEIATQQERQSVLAVALSDARDDSRRLSASEAELDRVSAELAEARARWQEAEDDGARLRADLGAAREAAQEADAEIRRLAAVLHDYDELVQAERAHGAEAAQAADRAARDAAELERQRDSARNELRRVVDSAKRTEELAARVPDLEQQLERTQGELAASLAELEQLKVRLQAVRAALQAAG